MASVSAFCYTGAQPVDILKIATFNINGIRSRLPALLEWLEREEPDVVCLQELKAPDAAFPIKDIHAAGYGAIAEFEKLGHSVLESWKLKKCACRYSRCLLEVPFLKRQSAPAVTTRVVKGNASLDLTDALVLVSCVRQKLSEPAPARLLYRSEWFNKVRTLVETKKADWLILSALYGVVAPDTCIAPYEKALNSAGVAERRAWAEKVRRQLAPSLRGRRRVVIFAGQRYREFLVPALQSDGYKVDVPMANLRIGEQLAWLAARS
jgi:exonuclease III